METYTSDMAGIGELYARVEELEREVARLRAVVPFKCYKCNKIVQNDGKSIRVYWAGTTKERGVLCGDCAKEF